jgi:hypothetical protein
MRFADKRVIAVLILAGALASCSCDSLEGLISRVGVTIDGRVKKEGQGALKIVVSEPAVVRLFETGNVNIEDAALVYQAKVRTEDIQGRVYLEMWCHFQGKGEFFSRGLDTSLSGTTKWTLLETSFFLKSGENPDNVKLNIVCEGSGTAWVDDIRMVKRGS